MELNTRMWDADYLQEDAEGTEFLRAAYMQGNYKNPERINKAGR